MPRSTLPAINPFEAQAATSASPARNAALAGFNDANDLAVYAKALRVFNPTGATAMLRVTYAGEASDAVFVDLPFPAGLTIEPSSVRRIWATGSNAALVVHAYSS